MFEQFTGLARRVMVLAQEEARMLRHDDIAAGRIPREARPGMRTVVVAGTPLRVAIRPGTGAGPPLLLASGIGASLEGFQPFVDALDPAIEVVRFDVPGVGGSPLPARPYPVHHPGLAAARAAQ